jgi:hypothetical protein
VKNGLQSLTALGIALFLHFPAHAQKEYRFKNEFSTGAEAERFFGLTPKHSRNDPKLDAGGFQFEVGSKLECGKIDVTANIKGQFKELQDQLYGLIPQNASEAKDLLARSAFTTICYAYPTICAQLRHDWLSIQGKLNLRAQACAAVDKFIDTQANKGSNQLKAEAIARCVEQEAGSSGDVASALQKCQGKSGLAMRDFQTGLIRDFGNGKQKVLKSILSFARDATSYDFLVSFLGEIQVGTEGGWVPLFDRGLLRPADVADTFLTKGQSLVCSQMEPIFAGRFRPSGVYETEVASLVMKKLSPQTAADLEELAQTDRQVACLALGRAVGKEAALLASARYESTLSTGLLNTAIPEPLRVEYRERAIAAFPALRQAIEGEDIPSVERVRNDLAQFAKLQRTKTKILAGETNRARLVNSLGDGRSASDCADSLSCE